MSLVKLKSSKLIIIVFLSAKREHIWIDVRVCFCPSALLRGRHYQGGAGADGTANRPGGYNRGGGRGAPEAGRVGSTEVGRVGTTEAVCC